MALTALDGGFIRANAALCALIGHPPDQLEAKDIQSITHPDDVEDDLEDRRRAIAGTCSGYRAERRLVRSDGEEIPVDLSVTLVRAEQGSPSHFVSQVVDMSERKRFEGQLQYLADHDPLTGLFNRRRFADELARELATATRYGATGALLALDLDHFKYVNDALGHSAGDTLITRVSITMRDRLRDTDVLARLGGDEFAVVLPQVSEAEAVLVAEQVLAAIRRDAQIEGGRRITASIGVAMFDDPDRVSAEELMIEADIAMYDAKETGRDKVTVFNVAAGRQERMQTRLTWADRIHDALEHEGFVLHAQPILCLDGDLTPRYELLIRMLGEDGDLIPPGAFLHLAERFDLIQSIDRWVVGEAIRKLFATRLRAHGCTFALDDFGSGFASFYYLKDLEFDYLKIDGEFIEDLTESHTNRLVVQSLVRIAKGLGKHTIAECVGDEPTLRLLTRYGVDYAQGFHIARPGPIDPDRAGGPAALPDVVRAR